MKQVLQTHSIQSSRDEFDHIRARISITYVLCSFGYALYWIIVIRIIQNKIGWFRGKYLSSAFIRIHDSVISYFFILCGQ